MNHTMTPLPYRVVRRHPETADTVTLHLEPCRDALAPWRPGQFTMIYAFGVGEVPISISAGGPEEIVHTVRAVGAVSAAICAAPVGSTLGLRGPFGRGWPEPAPSSNVVVMAGGIGLAPLRPVITSALARGLAPTVLIGSRTPADLIFTGEYDAWRQAGARVRVTVDRADVGWRGHVGVVTSLLAGLPPTTDGFGYVCGPEVMMRLGARALMELGLRAERIAVSLERNMLCGVGLCGHCQFGPLLVCRDGPVAAFGAIEPLLAVREL